MFSEYMESPEDQSIVLAGFGNYLLDLYKDQFNLRFIPVTPQEFLLSKEYLGKKEEVYPLLIPEFVEMNSGDYVELLLTGAIGVAKSTLALWSTAYQLYLLSAYKNPQKEFSLEAASEILFVFQSINASLAKSVDYDRFRATIEMSAYFQTYFPFDKDKQSQLLFPNRIIVKPISGESTGALGQNVFGGLLEEVNFMEVTEKSKRSVDKGTYDQAIELYNSLARRRKSRFMKQGRTPGLFCIVSSKKYPGQFTDIKEAEAREDIRKFGKSSIYVYDKRTWDVLPADRFSGKWFKVFIGDQARKPRIMDDGEPIKAGDEALVIDVPVEYRTEFERDIMNALRDIAGVSTLALFPFFQSREHVAEMFAY